MSPKELRSRRISLGLTIQQLARELGLTTAELAQIERGQSAIPMNREIARVVERLERQAAIERTRDCLIVEDDEAIRTLFARRLRAEGCTVDEAADGYEALDHTAMRDYRLMLLDLRLPKLSGAEVLARVTRKPESNTQVIVISAAGSADVREIANNRSVSAVLRKKFAIDNADVIFPALAALACGAR